MNNDSDNAPQHTPTPEAVTPSTSCPEDQFQDDDRRFEEFRQQECTWFTYDAGLSGDDYRILSLRGKLWIHAEDIARHLDGDTEKMLDQFFPGYVFCNFGEGPHRNMSAVKRGIYVPFERSLEILRLIGSHLDFVVKWLEMLHREYADGRNLD
jgi:hypothetical protein